MKVSPGCRFCYAEAHDRRHLLARDLHWGADAPRRFASEQTMRGPLAWDRAAARAGERRRVFCASMGDFFEIHPMPLMAQLQRVFRRKVFTLIADTAHLDWLLLTKRPENVRELVPGDWRSGFPANVWVGVSAENREAAERRLPILAEIPARLRFVSYEPALGPVDFSPWLRSGCLHWVIAGAESRPGRRAGRPANLGWFAAVRDQCRRAGVPFFLKQIAIDGAIVETPELAGRRWMEVP